MQLIIVSEHKERIDSVFISPIKGLQVEYLPIEPLNQWMRHMNTEHPKGIALFPVIDGKWQYHLLTTIKFQYPAHPILIISDRSFEKEAIQSSAQFQWDFFLLHPKNKDSMHQSLRLYFSRLHNQQTIAKLSIQLNEAKQFNSYLLGNLSHQIRTSLNAVIGMTEMLCDTELNSKQRYYAETIQESGNMLLTTFNDLLDFSRIEAGLIQLHDKPFNLLDSIRESLYSVLKTALEKKLEIVTEVEPEIPLMIMGDDLRLRQILMNLLDNAIKYTQTGLVKLQLFTEIQKAGPTLMIKVTDTGMGIAEEVIPHIFNLIKPKLSTAKQHTKGIGLGLVLCRYLTEKMDGSIELVSKLEEGTTFTVRIPLRPVSSEIAGPKIDVLHHKKVLYLTNTSLLDETIRFYCEKASMDFQLKTVHENYPETGVSFRNIDLIITHLRPDIKIDLQLIDTLREHEAIPLILIKERDKIDEKLIVIRNNVIILLKPVDMFEFWEAAEAVLTGKADSLFLASKHKQYDEHLGEYHPLDILIAEDNAINQRIILSILNRFGYQAKIVENGKEALESLERRKYDVVLTDIQMPVMDGLEATRQIRRHIPQKRQPYIIALTADALQQSRSEYLSHGVDEVLYKPVQSNALIQILSKIKRLER